MRRMFVHPLSSCTEEQFVQGYVEDRGIRHSALTLSRRAKTFYCHNDPQATKICGF
jgi:hypothetical protein